MDNEIDEVEEIKAEKKAEPKAEKKAEPKAEKKAEPKAEKKAEPKEVSDFASFMREGVTIVRHIENTFELQKAGWVKL